jgi:excisionase family DNA binding protein
MQKLLTSKEVMDRLSISLPTIHRLWRSGKLKRVKIRRATRYTEESVDRLIAEGLANPVQAGSSKQPAE